MGAPNPTATQGSAVTGVRASIRRVLARVHLARPLIWLRYRLLARRVGEPTKPADDGLPVPPSLLLVGISSQVRSVDWYLDSGRGDFEAIEHLLASHGVEARSLRDVLDFGCGCGRIARRWRDYGDVRIHGCDYDPRMAQWCRENLPFVEVRENELTPPLPYEADAFDFAYAFSVFTHLDESLQRPWLEEMHRVLRPGNGLLLISTLGRRLARTGLDPEDLERFDRDEIVIRFPEVSGEGPCLAFAPVSYVEQVLAASGFELLDRFDESRPWRGLTDFYLARAAP
jgi:SAM-dependent methyltransferase